MEQITEEKLRIEKGTLDAKREYKHALENLARVKSETNEVIAVKDRVSKDVEEKRKELGEILNDISNEKLTWALNKQADIDSLEKKTSEADNVIKRKGELNAQEETLRQIEARDIEVRNETRRIEVKIEADKVDLENREKQLVVMQKIIEKDKEKMENDKKLFKEKVAKVLSEVNEL